MAASRAAQSMWRRSSWTGATQTATSTPSQLHAGTPLTPACLSLVRLTKRSRCGTPPAIYALGCALWQSCIVYTCLRGPCAAICKDALLVDCVITCATSVQVWDTNSLASVCNFGLPERVFALDMSKVAAVHCLIAVGSAEPQARPVLPSQEFAV